MLNKIPRDVLIPRNHFECIHIKTIIMLIPDTVVLFSGGIPVDVYIPKNHYDSMIIMLIPHTVVLFSGGIPVDVYIPKNHYDCMMIMLIPDTVVLFSGGIPVDVYIPKNCGARPSILVHFHPGGYVMGSRKTDSSLCKLIARFLDLSINICLLN